MTDESHNAKAVCAAKARLEYCLKLEPNPIFCWRCHRQLAEEFFFHCFDCDEASTIMEWPPGFSPEDDCLPPQKDNHRKPDNGKHVNGRDQEHEEH